MFSISFAITYIVILTCVMFLNLIISLSVLWIDNDIIAYIALQKQPVLCGDTQRQKGTYFTAPFSVIIAFHSTFVNQSVFLIRVKFYISVFSSVYFLYN